MMIILSLFCATLMTFCYINFKNVRFSLNILLVGEESGQLEMFAYGVVHIGTVEFSQLGINNVSFTVLLRCCF